MKILKRNISFILVSCAALFFLFNFSQDIFGKKQKKAPKLSTTPATVKSYRPFVVIFTPSENQKLSKRGLQSVIDQEYPNFRKIILDDASLENLYLAIQSCKDEEILVFVEQGDWLASDYVLNWLNRTYENPNVWVTYGGLIEYPLYKRGKRNKRIPKDVHKSHSYRETSRHRFILPPLRTGYAGLFKQVKLQDLLKEGSFIKENENQALFLPVIEMAKMHARHVTDRLYVYNCNAAARQEPRQLATTEYIQSLPKYQVTAHWQRATPNVDIAIEAKHSSRQLVATLESIQENVHGYGVIWVIGSDEEMQEQFPSCKFVENKEDLRLSRAHYFLECSDGHIFNSELYSQKLGQVCFDMGVDYMTLQKEKSERVVLKNGFALGQMLKEQWQSPGIISKKQFLEESKQGAIAVLSLIKEEQ